ncbi:hypothetical protein [Yinghuangia soli]|uniref:Uncharacterized protein n=1 Tax=Yinghuangia soli TaxID=2908204 RepID=A0AA41Q0C7_9ACTN|nr:hypothetical protein [Yinghuangia soli]MCF2528986.1 hypothetical protein [Yinghuangia soli]
MPQPDGPISAVTVLAAMVRSTRSSTLWLPNQALTARASRVDELRPGCRAPGTDADAGTGAMGKVVALVSVDTGRTFRSGDELRVGGREFGAS